MLYWETWRVKDKLLAADDIKGMGNMLSALVVIAVNNGCTQISRLFYRSILSEQMKSYLSALRTFDSH